MASKYLTTLRTQASLIEKTYIDFQYDPAGNYTKRNLMNAGAYVLLVHAELETYLEERVHEVLRLADKRWRTNGKPCRTLLAASIYFVKSQALPQVHSTKDNFSSLIVQAVKDADNRIGKNNGIRQHNFIQLLHAVGYEVPSVDPLLVAELDAIGSIRGDHAHKSPRHNFQTKFDPFDLTKKIANALTLLDVFDKDFSAFRKTQFGY